MHNAYVRNYVERCGGTQHNFGESLSNALILVYKNNIFTLAGPVFIVRETIKGGSHKRMKMMNICKI